MPDPDRRVPRSVSLTDRELARIEEQARIEGAASVSEYVRILADRDAARIRRKRRVAAIAIGAAIGAGMVWLVGSVL